MSWIRNIAEAEAGPALAPIYHRIRARSAHGRVSNLWLALGHDPAMLDASDALYCALVKHPAPLSSAQECFPPTSTAVTPPARAVTSPGTDASLIEPFPSSP